MATTTEREMVVRGGGGRRVLALPFSLSSLLLRSLCPSILLSLSLLSMPASILHDRPFGALLER